MDPELLNRLNSVESALLAHEVNEFEETALEIESRGERLLNWLWAAGMALGIR